MEKNGSPALHVWGQIYLRGSGKRAGGEGSLELKDQVWTGGRIVGVISRKMVGKG